MYPTTGLFLKCYQVSGGRGRREGQGGGGGQRDVIDVHVNLMCDSFYVNCCGERGRGGREG